MANKNLSLEWSERNIYGFTDASLTVFNMTNIANV